MSKRKSLRGLPLLTQFGLMIVLLLMISAAALWRISAQVSESTFSQSDRAELRRSCEKADEWLGRYLAGELDRGDLTRLINPQLNPGQVFLMLLDRQGEVLAFTRESVPYFGSEKLSSYLERLGKEPEFNLTERDTRARVVITGRRTDNGYILSGKPTRTYRSSMTAYRQRLGYWVIPGLMLFCALMLVLSLYAARPLRQLKRAAQEVGKGNEVHLDTDLPGEAGDVAAAFNRMSSQVSGTIAELTRQEQNIHRMIEALSEGILALTDRGELIEENAASRELLGSDTAERATVQKAIRDSLRTGEGATGRIQRGEDVLQYDIVILSGDNRGAMAVVRNVTEDERLERTRFDYVANISHELRTPLANMRGLTEGLKDGLVTEESERQRYYELLLSEIRRLSRLVNDLLELSGLQSNPAAFETERVAPTETMLELYDIHKQAFSVRRQALILDLPSEDLPEIITNEDRLSEVLTIFLDNARKFTPEGGHVTLGAAPVLEDGIETGIRFFVRDDGAGMDEETQRLVFDRFHQGDRSHAGQGSGLGLSIAREILRKMGVGIDLKSRLGEGSEFSFILPVP